MIDEEFIGTLKKLSVYLSKSNLNRYVRDFDNEDTVFGVVFSVFSNWVKDEYKKSSEEFFSLTNEERKEYYPSILNYFISGRKGLKDHFFLHGDAAMEYVETVLKESEDIFK